MNVIFQRVLPNDEVRQRWHRDYGMPIDEEVMKFSGGWGSSYDCAIYQNKYTVFQRWLTEKGLRSYAKDILRHPIPAMSLVMKNLPYIIDTPRSMTLYRSENMQGISQYIDDNIFSVELRPWADFLFVFLALLSLACAVISTSPLSGAAMGVAIFAMGMPLQLAIVVLADAMEVTRHGLAVTVTVRLLIIILIPIVCASVYKFLNYFSRPLKNWM